jgi:hypothetical protein
MANHITGAISTIWQRCGPLVSVLAGAFIARWASLRLRIGRLARRPKQLPYLPLGLVWIASDPPDLSVDQKVEFWFRHWHADYLSWLERYGRGHWHLSAEHSPGYVELYSSGSYFEVALAFQDARCARAFVSRWHVLLAGDASGVALVPDCVNVDPFVLPNGANNGDAAPRSAARTAKLTRTRQPISSGEHFSDC